MSLTRIPLHVEKKISASSDIKSFTKAIEELVYNAFDAKSTSIAIRVFIQEGSIQVIDNGCGILEKDFKFLGHRYYTSKHGESQFYGYRGSSLASIAVVSERVKITSRYQDGDTDCTFTKTFIGGKELDVVESTRPSKGTTVVVTGFLYNYHIQKNAVNSTNEISHIKAFLERISLAHCTTSISLRDDSKNDIVFQVKKHRDIIQTLQSLYEIRQQDVQELQVNKNDYKIHGFIEKTNDGEKKYRFIFVNGRFIRNNKLQSSIDKRLKSNNCNVITKRKRVFDVPEKVTSDNLPYYFIFIKCPQKDYNIDQNNEETYIEFKNWEKIDKLVEKLIKFYKGDLKVKEIKNDCLKNNNKMKEDTQNQVRKIMQKFLDTSVKKPKRLRLKTGIIGKHATRKDIKKTEKLSISKIVSKQFRSRFKELCSNSPNINKNIIKETLISHESNKETHLQIDDKEIEENGKVNDANYKQNNANNWNSKKKRNHLRISQDPLSKRFINPTDTIIQRCDMLLENLQKHFVGSKAIDHNIRYATRKRVQAKLNDNNYKNHYITTHKQKLIKTSNDLVKSFFDYVETSETNFIKAVNNKKIKIVKPGTFEYSKISPSNKRKKIIQERSCSTFHCTKTLHTVYKKKKNKKDNRQNKLRHGVKQKSTVENIFTEQSMHTIKTFESHIRDNARSDLKSIENRSYISHIGHRFVRETLCSKTYDTNKVTTPNIDNAKYDFHKTYTTEIHNNRNHYSQVVEKQLQRYNRNETLSDVTFNKILSSNENFFLNTNQFNLCETLFHNSTIVNKEVNKSLHYDNNNMSNKTNDLYHKYYNANFNLQHYNIIERDNSDFLDHNIIRNNNNNISKTSNFYVEKQHKVFNPVVICETLFQNSTAENCLFDDSFYNNLSMKYKINKNDCVSHHSVVDDHDSKLFHNTKKRNDNTNVNESSKVTLQKQVNTTNTQSIFETELQDSVLHYNAFEEDFIHNESMKDKQLNSGGNIEPDEFSLYFITEDYNRLSSNVIKTVNINENDKVSEQGELIDTAINGKPSFVINANKDFPVSVQGFKLNSRLCYIPKGMSQINVIHCPKVPQSEEQGINYYDNDIYTNFTTNLQTFSEVLKPGVPNLNDLVTKGIKHVIKPSINDPIFDEVSLKEAKVIGQVDNKFIGAKVTARNALVNKTSEFLVLFDQHAVDERIRLENNLADYFDGDAWNSVSIDLSIKLPKDIITYLHNYKEKFIRFGLEWTCNGDEVSIKGIPKAIVGQHTRQIDVIMKAVKSLISEEVEAIKYLKGNISLHPKSIMDLVLSEACRYAIKFGDILLKSECEDLLNRLSTCKLPFQCAHGRPVMAVIMELCPNSYEYKINMECVKKMKH